METTTIRIIPALLIGLAITATFFPLLLGKFPAVGDIRDVHIPLELFFQHETREGRIPSWNPDIAWGFPVIASAQIGYFYPPLLILRPLLPIQTYLPLIIIAHFCALGWGMYALVRTLNYSKQAAYLAAISCALGGFALHHITHLNIVLALAWFPWQIVVAHRITQQQAWTRKPVSLLALILALPFLIGQIQLPFLMAAMTCIYLIQRNWKLKQKRFATLGICTVLAGAVIAVAAVQLLPTLELAKYSSRGAGGDFSVNRANQHSFPLYHLPTTIFPQFFNHDDKYWGKRLEIEYGIYIGTLPLALATMAAIKGMRRKGWKIYSTDQRITFWIWTALATFLLALGSLSPFRLIGIEPSLWIFSAPARWLFFTVFSLAILAAHGFDMLHNNKATFKKLCMYAAITITSAVVITNGILFSIKPESIQARSDNPYYTNKISQLIQSARESSLSLRSPYTAIPIILLIATTLSSKRKRIKPLILTVTTIELVILGYTNTAPFIPWRNILAPPEILQQLPETIIAQQARIFAIRQPGDTGAYFTDPNSRANAHIREQKRQVLVPLIHAQFDIASVEWPASLDIQEQQKALEKLRGSEGYYIQDLQQAYDLNIGTVLVPSDLAQPQNLSPTIITPQTTGYELKHAPRAEMQDKDGTVLNAHVSYQQITPTKKQITVATQSPGTLIIRDTWYPGWEATNGTTTLQIDHYKKIFQAIEVPAGQYVITLRYVPRQLFIGMIISLCTLLLLTSQTLRYSTRDVTTAT